MRPPDHVIDAYMAQVLKEVHSRGLMPLFLVAVPPDGSPDGIPCVLACGPGIPHDAVRPFFRMLADAEQERAEANFSAEGG